MKGLLGFLLSLAIHYFLFEFAQSSFQGSTLASGFNHSWEGLNTSDVSGLKEVSLQLSSIHLESLSLKASEQIQEEPGEELEAAMEDNFELSEKSRLDLEEKFSQVSKLIEEPLQEREKNKPDEPQFDAKDLDESKTKPEMTELRGRKSVPKPEITHQRVKEISLFQRSKSEMTEPRDSGSEPVSKGTHGKLDEVRTKDKPKMRPEVRNKAKFKNIEASATDPPQPSNSMASSYDSNSTKRSESKGILEAPEILVRGKLIYPRVARRRGWQGKVVIEFSIDSDGTASDFRFVKKAPYDLLNREAVRSLNSYRFAKSAGSSGASSLRYTLSFEFRLD